MELQVPSAAAVRAALASLTLKQLDRLAELSGVPATTIYKIKRGETPNPGIATVGKFMPHVDEVRVQHVNDDHPTPTATTEVA